MKVSEAIKDLTESLGTAMGASAGDHANDDAAKTGGNVGDSMRKAHVDMKSDESRHFVTVKFEGEHQPESAQTLFYMLTNVMGDLGIKEPKNPSRTHTEDFDGHGRKIEFSVSKDKKEEFVTRIKGITEAVRGAPELQDQYRTAAEFVAEYVRPIEGISTLFKLNAHPAVQTQEGAEPAPGPHFELQMDRVPEALAAQIAHHIAESTGKHPEPYDDSPSRRIEGKVFRGKSVKIDLSSSDSQAAFDAIRSFSERVSRLPTRESGLEIGASA